MRREVVLAFAIIGLAVSACAPTPTPAPTAEPTPVPTRGPTSTPVPTWTLTPTPTNRPAKPTATSTATSTPTPTFPPFPTATFAPTDLPGLTATFTATLTLTPTSTLTATFTPTSTLVGEAGVVHAVLFYSPSCPYCRKVMTEVLPPLQETYGDQLQIAMIDVSTAEGADLYLAAADYFDIPSDRRGVPTMVVGSVVLVGAQEIPELLPDLIEQGLAEGGVGWPTFPGFEPPPME